MKLEIQSGEDTFTLDVRVDGENVLATVEDREYELEVSETEPGVYLIRRNGHVYPISVSAMNSAGNLEVNVKNRRFDVTVYDPKRIRGSGSDHSQSGGNAEIKTAMPGKVVRIIANVGQEVKKGSGVIVVEAMKMQNEMRSPIDGVIKEVRVTEGSTVNAGQVLVIIG
jgi:biotin carboxyl carrier protein